jgi:hypothetical protein
MIRLFLASAGLGLSCKLFYISEDFVTQTICLLFIPLFVLGVNSAIKQIAVDDNDE